MPQNRHPLWWPMGLRLKHHCQAFLSHPCVPRGDKESVYKDEVVLGYVTHLAHPLSLSFRTLQVIRDMNETFQALQEISQHTHSTGVTCPRTQPVPEAGIPTMEHPCCSAVQAVATTHHHHLSLHKEAALNLVPVAAQAEPEGSPRSAACTEEFLVFLRSK